MKKTIPFLEKKFQKIIESNKLLDIKLFQINDAYVHFPENKLWVIDGGIELTFTNYIFCFCWDFKKESFVFENKTFKEIYTETSYTELNNELFNNLKNKKVTNANFNWIICDVIVDYTMATKKEKNLIELKLSFDSNNSLQIATVDYNIENEKYPNNFTFNLNGEELFLSINNFIEIKE